MVFVIEGSFLGIDWAALAALATMVGVGVAAVGSYLAWTGLQSQIAVAQKQHLAALSASRRPRLVLRNVVIHTSDSKVMPRGVVKNIGVGPAIAVAIDVWYFTAAAPGRYVSTAETDLGQLASNARLDRPSSPDARGLPGGLGAGEANESFDLPVVSDWKMTIREGEQLVAAWRATYQDIDGEPYSSLGLLAPRNHEGELITNETLQHRDAAPN